MAENEYYELIEETFNEVENSLEALPDDVDVRIAEGVISATFTNGVVFVFSRQPPTRQLWLATPGGGFHFQWRHDERVWVDTKSGESFNDCLRDQVQQHTGLLIELGRA